MTRYRKLWRELKRPVDQLRSAALYPFDIIAKRRHDRQFHSKSRLTDGAQAGGVKFAILLIYQPKGLARTTVLTCQHLAENGYSVLLVSNAALSQDVRTELAPFVWKILERPNIGYDFGGYRDGLRVLREAKVDLQALVVMNDSIWWPLCAEDTALKQMEQMGADVSGFILRPPGKPRKRSTNRTPHLQSYFYWFGRKALDSDAFTRFWADYRLSSFKYNAIRHGELHLTGRLMAAGLTVRALFSFEALMEKLRDQSDAYLCKTLRYGVYKDAGMAQAAKRLEATMPQTPEWRAAVFDLFAQMDRQSEFHLALRFPSVDLLKLNFLKRSIAEPKGSMHHVGRSHYLDAISNGDVPAPIDEVLSEIEARHRLGGAAVGR